MEPWMAEREQASDAGDPEPPGSEAATVGDEREGAGAAAENAPPPPPGSERGSEEHLGERLLRELAALRDLVEERFALDRFREDQVERLHRDLQDHKQDFLARLQHPLLLGLIRFRNDLGRTVAALRERPVDEQTPERFLATLDGLEDDLLLLLEHHGVERFEAPGPEFDPARQTALRLVETAEAELVGRVVERLRSGFTHGKTQLQREGVAVYAAGTAPGRAAPPADVDLEIVPGGEIE